MKSLLVVGLILMAGASLATATEHVVEMYIVVEPKVIRNYQHYGYDQATAISTIASDIDYLIYQVNEMFKSMSQYGLDVTIRAKQVDFLEPTQPVFEDCVLIRGTDVQADMAMEVFKEWLKGNNARSTIGYDMAMIMTGYDLFSTFGDNQVAGYASVAATCEENGISVVEFVGTMSTATVIAHEIAHSLGAHHVSYDPTSSCSSQFGFIMNPVSSPAHQHRWSFSQCTANAISTYINSLSPNCLTDTTTPASSFQMSDAANADILDVEKICSRKLNSTETYFCHYFSFYDELKGDKMCQTLYCGFKGSLTCYTGMPSEGMICDVNKRCEKGKCVATTIPMDVDTHCLFGDIQSEYIQSVDGQTCEAYLTDHLDACYNSWAGQERCCATCRSMMSDIEGCPYGDRNPACSLYTPEQVCPSNSEVCCQKCQNFINKRSVRRSGGDVKLPDVTHDQQPPAPPVVADDTPTKKTGPPSATD